MLRLPILQLLFFLVLLFFSFPLWGQDSLSGFVLDAESKSPLAAVRVEVLQLYPRRFVHSQANGYFQLSNLGAPPYRLYLSIKDYYPQEVFIRKLDSLPLEVFLIPLPAENDSTLAPNRIEKWNFELQPNDQHRDIHYVQPPLTKEGISPRFWSKGNLAQAPFWDWEDLSSLQLSPIGLSSIFIGQSLEGQNRLSALLWRYPQNYWGKEEAIWADSRLSQATHLAGQFSSFLPQLPQKKALNAQIQAFMGPAISWEQPLSEKYGLRLWAMSPFWQSGQLSLQLGQLPGQLHPHQLYIEASYLDRGTEKEDRQSLFFEQDYLALNQGEKQRAYHLGILAERKKYTLSVQQNGYEIERGQEDMSLGLQANIEQKWSKYHSLTLSQHLRFWQKSYELAEQTPLGQDSLNHSFSSLLYHPTASYLARPAQNLKIKLGSQWYLEKNQFLKRPLFQLAIHFEPIPLHWFSFSVEERQQLAATYSQLFEQGPSSYARQAMLAYNYAWKSSGRLRLYYLQLSMAQLPQLEKAVRATLTTNSLLLLAQQGELQFNGRSELAALGIELSGNYLENWQLKGQFRYIQGYYTDTYSRHWPLLQTGRFMFRAYLDYQYNWGSNWTLQASLRPQIGQNSPRLNQQALLDKWVIYDWSEGPEANQSWYAQLSLLLKVDYNLFHHRHSFFLGFYRWGNQSSQYTAHQFLQAQGPYLELGYKFSFQPLRP